jgi:hypothetical protein
MNISELFKNNPEIVDSLTIQVNASDLKEFAELCINRGKQEKPETVTPEEYLTPNQMAETLQVSLVTLWSWDKKQITKPLRIGNKKLYRRSDLEKILCNA